MNLLHWAAGFLGLALFFGLQQLLGWTPAGAALVTGLAFLVLALVVTFAGSESFKSRV